MLREGGERLSNDAQKRATESLFREVGKDFEGLVRLIERAIEHIAINDSQNAAIECLDRAKKAAEKGAKLASEARQRSLEP